jgi:hypothetical protein
MTRYGWKRAEETYPQAKKKKKKRKRKRKSLLTRTNPPANDATKAHATGKEQRRLAHEARVRKQKEKAAIRKEKRRLEHEARIEAARQAKAVRLADPAYQAKKAAERLKRRQKRKARRQRQTSLKSVTVVQWEGGREVVVQTGTKAKTQGATRGALAF